MNRRHFLAAPTLLAGLPFAARAAEQPVVIELFTSQSCSSCPPADALLGELARERPDVLALSFHVTYWDRNGWRDPFSLREATERQRRYSSTLVNSRYRGQVYTPQLVVQGQAEAIGSDRPAVLAAIEAARNAPRIPLTVTPNTTSVTMRVGAGSGVGTVWLIGYDPLHETEVRGGENGGRKLTEANVVRSIAQVGAWIGQPLRVDEPKPQGERIAVLLQAAGGGILGAAAA
ncbi:DUF1223 domain-containing protein [Roseococcus sp.]|uniref:DUF1223 domain-containing protein n=1 Tax=Roseococcus sp. TaxID=2109646 RepID=UPI003BAD9A71